MFEQVTTAELTPSNNQEGQKTSLVENPEHVPVPNRKTSSKSWELEEK